MVASPLQSDPTRTATLRRVLQSRFKGRVRGLRSELYARVVREGAFGLSTRKGEWAHLEVMEQVAAFTLWLHTRLNLLGKEPWWLGVLQQAYLRGAGDTYEEIRKGALESPTRHQAGKREFLQQVHQRGQGFQLGTSRLTLLSLQFAEEVAETQRMVQRGLVNTLVTRLPARPAPLDLFLQLATEVLEPAETRVMALAGTVVIRAYVEGQLDGYTLLGVRHVRSVPGIQSRNCPTCGPLAQRVHTVQEARGVLPAHRNCRCGWRAID